MISGRVGRDRRMNIEKFLENVIEQIKELQLKLGFAREVIRLYYPAESLGSLLEVECSSGKELLDLLQKERAFSDTRLGAIGFAGAKERIQVCISAEGATYVHEQVPDPVFLAGLIRLFQERHDLGIEDICAYFAKAGEHFVCWQMEPGEDFDYVLYFADGKPDAWVYCVKAEMEHTVYHRFSREDWAGVSDIVPELLDEIEAGSEIQPALY